MRNQFGLGTLLLMTFCAGAMLLFQFKTSWNICESLVGTLGLLTLALCALDIANRLIRKVRNKD